MWLSLVLVKGGEGGGRGEREGEGDLCMYSMFESMGFEVRKERKDCCFFDEHIVFVLT